MIRKILFLCTGNSARSQMAEALVNHLRGERWQAVSAGTHPTGYVNPLVIDTLKEIGIDGSSARSKSIDEFRDTVFDLVMTVCDSAAEECPLWLGQGQLAHIGFPDPARGTMDMSPAYIAGADENIGSQARVVFDKFHVIAHVSKAVDDTRRQESRQDRSARPVLKGTQWLCRKNPENLREKEAAEIKVIEEYLPAGASDEEIARVVDEAIAATAAASPKDMGKVMSRAAEVEVSIGIDHPAKFSFYIANGNGHVEYHLAPRIEAD